MGLYDRIMHLEEPAISSHVFSSGVYEFAVGNKTAAQLKAFWSLDATAGAELDTLLATISGGLAAKAQRIGEIHFVLLGAEVGAGLFTTSAAVKTRLGV